MERVHLRNLLLGEFKGDVAKIWSCSLGGELTGINELARRKTNLACLYCGVGALPRALFNQVQEPLLLTKLARLEKEVKTA